MPSLSKLSALSRRYYHRPTSEFGPKYMKFRRLRPSWLKVQLFLIGGWLTYEGDDPLKPHRRYENINIVFENGINMFDTVKGYKELGYRISEFVVSMKILVGYKLRTTLVKRIIK
ncbi:hypothetical protein DFS33DRAFT_1386582 [Desarmillaria ectypa]|nr:hypothetical protein DFS33DRAFT_1386582 [Desarmillaria ectypa]